MIIPPPLNSKALFYFVLNESRGRVSDAAFEGFTRVISVKKKDTLPQDIFDHNKVTRTDPRVNAQHVI